MTTAERGTDADASPPAAPSRNRFTAPLRWLRVRVPVTAMAVLAVSLGVAAFLAYELLLQDGLRDIDVVIDREEQRFERSIAELLEDARAERPDAEERSILESAVRRYLQLNPSTASYWTIVTFEDGFRLAASNGPPELEPLFRARTLPAGELGTRQTIDTGTEAGAIRTSSVPISVDGASLATLQVVSPIGPVRADAREAASLVAAAAGVSLLVGGVLLAVTLWRALSPLGSLAAAARSTELPRLSERVDVPTSDDEVALLAREFNTMLDRLEASARQQQEFLASVGHELRTPITIARGHLELLTTVDRDDAAAVDATAAIVRDELGRMGRLVDDLMAIARVQTADFIRPRPLELVGWFEELELKIAATPAGGATRVVPPPPVVLQADPDRLAQAVLNLTTNAAIHSPEGTPITVTAEVDATRRQLTLRVSDEGPGIDPAILDEVFSPFVRAGDARDSTGLGLAVVEAVITAHGGDIEVSSDPTGTAVTLRLPLEGTGAPSADADARPATAARDVPG